MEVITAGIGAMLSDPMCFVVLLFGVLMGIIFGCIPGLTATLGVALMIPITYTMTAHQGLTLLIAIYVGGISGGLITATLINIPGTPSSIFTCYDGYPMTKAGRPGEALTIGVFASLIGGTASALALILIAPQLAKVVLAFGSWEYFAVCILGLAVVITMSCEDVVKGLIGALLGLLLGCVGIDAVSGVSRLDFGNWQLQGGIQSTALMMGLFAIREILHQSVDLKEPRMHISMQKTSFLPHLKEMKGCAKPIALGCLIGTGIGILPGIGQNAATMITYNQSKSVSKHPERFGHGSPEGICASETSNNAVNGGALIPLVTMGIPGDLTTSALLGGLTIHGLQAGPLLFTQNPDIIGTIMVAYALANFVMYIMELGLLKLFIVLRILLFAAAAAAAGRGAFRMFFTRLQAKRTVGGYLKQLDDGYLGPHHLYTAGPSLLCRYGTQTKSVSGSAIQSIIPLKSCAALVADGVIFDAIPIQVVQETHLDDLLLRFAADCQRQELAELAEKLRHDLEKEAPIQQVFSWPDDAATLERQVTGHRLYYTTVRAWRGGTLIRLLIGLYGLGVLLLGGNIYLGAGFFLLGYFLSRQFLLCFTPAVRRITATALGQASQDAQCTLFVQAEKLTLLQRGSVLTMEKPTFAAKRASRTALCLYGTNAEMLTLPRELADETNMQKFFS